MCVCVLVYVYCRGMDEECAFKKLLNNGCFNMVCDLACSSGLTCSSFLPVLVLASSSRKMYSEILEEDILENNI